MEKLCITTILLWNTLENYYKWTHFIIIKFDGVRLMQKKKMKDTKKYFHGQISIDRMSDMEHDENI